MWTLLTFPMAYIGWYITKRNWLSVLIFAPVLAFLGYTAVECLKSDPRLVIAALFCVLQILLYCFAFFPKLSQKLAGIAVPAAAAVVFLLLTPQLALTAFEPLPDAPALSAKAEITVADDSVASIQISDEENAILYIYAHKYGSTEITVTDNGKEYRYTVEICKDNGSTVVRVTSLQ